VVEGPSGSGKSTLLATIMGFLPPASGQLLMSGGPGRIAWCPQEGHLFDSTVRGNLLLARGRDDRPDDAELLRVLELTALPFGLDTRVGPGGSRLSGGERQRLAVARTLLARADVVLLDEPTAHLDEANAERLMANLRVELADRIVVLVTHHPSERRVGDRPLRFSKRPDELPSRASGAASSGSDGTQDIRGDSRMDRLGVARVVDAREHVALQPR
jgi:ATP-binding cassette subfamily C protein CydCD